MPGARKILFSIFRTIIGIALVLYLWRSGAIRWEALAGLLTHWALSLAALALLFLDAAVLGWRLRILLLPRGFHLPVSSAFRLTLIGTFFNSCLPGATGGDLVKIYYATEGNPGRATEVGTIILLDRLAGMFALMLLPLLLLPFFPHLLSASPELRAVLWLVSGLAASTLAGALICFSERIRHSAPADWAIRKLPFGRFLGIVYDTVHAYRQHPAPLGPVGEELPPGEEPAGIGADRPSRAPGTGYHAPRPLSPHPPAKRLTGKRPPRTPASVGESCAVVARDHRAR